MTTDPIRRGPKNPEKINVDDNWEVGYWAGRWGIPVREVLDAVRVVGTSTADVTGHLAKR
ncbi:DUF3606 domain-containing protein [Pararoseomonas sp. SCSIO 73927]|uniref:DUF3606 domain-containing protein n=1 Tax=Pararoseomonas sp. SCSIO 73927 TaxID=3114537 RepID=UPI0038CFDCCF